ncbi:MAG: filamentous hemagglutinin N-terminal domain-containing protein [Burkholderiales bacterium]|nr:filamentous hemagglutinin N-terminal domain-containing protein [Burkholderiales bacterium]
MNRSHARPWNIRRNVLATAVACCFAPPLVLANPVGPAVMHGQATFNTQGKLLTVTNSPGSIIHWQGFSIGAGETTRFVQQNAASAVLNRVIGADPSSILGALQSNGRVFLVNPNGIIFGNGALIDTAGLVASTLNIMNADFLSGKLRFGETPGAKSISNAGEIRTPAGGRVLLISPEGVTNSGIIHTPKGEVILAAGKSVELTDSANPEVRIELSAPEGQAVNLGKIVAEAGKIGIYGGIVANRGRASADSAVVGENGKIVLRASRDASLDAASVTSASGPSGGVIEVNAGGTTLVAGQVAASGSEAKGGEVRLLGERVGVANGASVDVSGERGGGTVLVGGDLQGTNPAVRNAQTTYVGAGARIAADALTSGDGGKVIVWADDSTRSYGAISARGGARSGDGGLVETSGKRALDVRRGPDVRAPGGRNGTWLLDPNDLEVVAGSEFNDAINSGAPFFAPLADSSRIGVNLINAQLDFGSNVLLTTTSRGDTAGTQAGNITISAPIVKRAETVLGGPFIGTTSLTLQAHNDIVIGAGGSITSTGDPLSVSLVANSDNAGGGAVSVGGAIITRGGSFSASGAGVALNAPVNTMNAQGTFGSSVQLTSTGAANVAAAVTGGFFSASGQTGVGISAPIASTSSVQASSAAGAITVAANIGSTSSVSLTGNKGVRVAAGSQISAGQFSSFNASVTDATSASTLAIEAGAAISSSGGAVFTSDNMDIQGLVNVSGGSITLRQNTAGRPINIGTEVGSALSLTQLELDKLLGTGSFSLGNSSTGPITVAGPVTGTLPGFVSVQSGTSFTQNAGVSLASSLSINAPAITIAAPLSSTSANSISLNADTLAVNAPVSSAGNIDIAPRSFNRAIALGVGAPTGSALEVSAAQLNNFITPTRVRFSTSGPITIDGPIAPTGTSTLSLASSNNAITQPGGGASVTVPNLALSARTQIDFPRDNDVTNLAAQITCCNAGNINFVAKPGKLVNIGPLVDGLVGVTVNNFSGVGNVMLQADDMSITGSVRVNQGDVKLLPRSVTTVTLGNDAAGTLGLTGAEIGQVQATNVTIAGDRMDVTGPVSFSAADTTLGPVTANRAVSIVAAKGNPAELEFTPGDFANITGNVRIGGTNAGSVSVNTATAIPGSVPNFILHSGNPAASAIAIGAGANVSATNSIGLIADSMAIGANVASSNGSINIATHTPARKIDIGIDPGGSLGFDTTELGRFSAPLGTLQFTTTGGDIMVTGAVAFAGGSVGAVGLDAGGTASTFDSVASLTSPGPLTLRASAINLNGNLTTGAGKVALIGNTVAIGPTSVVTAAGDVDIMPRDFRAINVGGNDVPGSTLGIAQAELTNINPGGILRIGETSGLAGNIDVSAAVTLPANRVLSLKTGSGSITQTGAIVIPNGSLAAEASGVIALNQPNQVSNVALMSQFDAVSFVRAPGGAGPVTLNVTAVDNLNGVRSGSGNPVTLRADRIDINTANPNVFVQGGAVALLPSANGAIDIGTKPGGGGFGLIQSELDRIFANSVTVGEPLSGNITVSQPISLTTSNDLALVTGASKMLTIAPAAALTAPQGITLTAGTLSTNAAVTGTAGSVNLTADAITLGGTVTSGGGFISVQPITGGTMIAVGGADAAGTPNTLGLDATDLGNLAYGSGVLSLGSTNAGNMTVTHAGALPGSVALATGGLATFSANTFSATDHLSIRATTMSIPGVAGIAAGTGIDILPATAGRGMTLGGGAQAGSGLDLTTAELGKISIGSPSGALVFDTSGTLTTVGALSFSLVSNIDLKAGTIQHGGGTLSAPGAIALYGDNIPSGGFAPVTSTGGGRIVVAPRTFRSMNLGTAPGGAVLGLLPAQIAALSTSGVVQFGDLANTNQVTIGAPITQPAGSSALAILANGNITQTAGAGNTVTASNLRLHSTNGVNLTDNNAVGTLAGSSSGSFAFTATGTLTIGTVDGMTGVSDSTVTLRADSLDVAAAVIGGNVTLAPRSAGAAIDLGTDSGFGLTNAEINRISASTLNIGTTATNPTGAITVSAAVDRLSGGNLNLVTAPGSSIAVNATLGSSNTSNITLNAGSGGTASVNAPVQASGSISVNADTITTTQSITSDSSNVTLSNVGPNGSVTVGGALNGYFNTTITGKTIVLNAPVNANYDFGSIGVGAAAGTTGSSVTVNQTMTAGSSISIQTDTIAINAPLVTRNSTVTLQPRTANRPISLGSEVAGAFSIDANELARINTANLTVGSTSAGALSVNAPITSSTLQSLSLRSGGDITQQPTAPIVLTYVTVDPHSGFAQPAATLSVTSASGEINLPADNNVNSRVLGQAGGANKNFVFKNVSPLKIQNLSSELVFAPTGKVRFNAPPGSLVVSPVSGNIQDALVDASLASILEAQDTQSNADKSADERKEEGEKKDREEEKKKGTQSCS